MKSQSLVMLIPLAFPVLAAAKNVPTNAAANLVLGQSNFTTSSTLSPASPFTLYSPTGVAVDPVSRKVFVADSSANRVLRFKSASALSNGAAPEAVFGQPKFSSTSSANGEQGMSRPTGLFFDRKGRLWVADSNNNRILMFEIAAYRETQPYADKVIGQPNFTTVTSDVTNAKLDDPYGVCVDKDDRLWVSDDDNNRVLRFDSISTKSNGAAADGVLGQINFTTSTAGSGSSGLQGPIGISVSSAGTLYVACNGGNRVMRFDNAATLGNGAGATVVLGQADFSTTTGGTSSTKFSIPYGAFIASDDTLWVNDYGNARVLRFDKASTKTSGAAADGVVGKPDFVTSTTQTTNRGIGGIFTQCTVDATGSLWVPDYVNNRVLRFPADATKPTLAVTTNVPSSVSGAKLTIKGTASDTYGISKVQYKVGNGATKTATGTTSWQFKASLKPGQNKIVITAIDSVGNKSANKTITVTRK